MKYHIAWSLKSELVRMFMLGFVPQPILRAYGLVRHLMYSAVIIRFVAAPVALGSRFVLIPAALLIAMIIVRTFF